MKNKIFLILGKSCSGKDSIFTMLQQDLAFMKEENLSKLPSCTTRPKRAGEREGREYHFATMTEFDKLYKQGKVAEYNVYHTKVGAWVYFTLKEDIDKSSSNLIGIKNPLGYTQLKDIYSDKLVIIQIDAPQEVLKQRYESRGATSDSYEDRAKRDNEDFKYLKPNYIVVNDGSKKIEEVVEEVKNIIKKELAN